MLFVISSSIALQSMGSGVLIIRWDPPIHKPLDEADEIFGIKNLTLGEKTATITPASPDEIPDAVSFKLPGPIESKELSPKPIDIKTEDPDNTLFKYLPRLLLFESNDESHICDVRKIYNEHTDPVFFLSIFKAGCVKWPCKLSS